MKTEKVGQRIRKFMAEKELSLDALAEQTGLESSVLTTIVEDDLYPSLGPLLKIARAALARGHRVRIYAIRWEAPLPDDDLDVHLIEVDAIANHTLYERFAERVLAHVQANPVDLLVGMNKMPGLDLYYAADPCFKEKLATQKNWLTRRGPRIFAFQMAT